MFVIWETQKRLKNIILIKIPTRFYKYRQADYKLYMKRTVLKQKKKVGGISLCKVRIYYVEIWSDSDQHWMTAEEQTCRHLECNRAPRNRPAHNVGFLEQVQKQLNGKNISSSTDGSGAIE